MHRGGNVIETMTPPGVEHTIPASSIPATPGVIETMTPPGVEHLDPATVAYWVDGA